MSDDGDSDAGPTDPFAQLETVLDQLTALTESPTTDVPVDVVDEGDRLAVRADLPGYDADDVEVLLDDERTLRIRAERETDVTGTEADFVTRERHHESVQRRVSLPTRVDPGATTAGHDAGVLTVHLPKRTDGAGTSIPVE